MERQLKPAENALQKSSFTKQGLYNKYGAMLLGYIFEVVNNRQLAEQYLVELFADLQQPQIVAITRPGVNTFINLQQMARKKVAVFAATLAECPPEDRPKGILIKNAYIDRMDAEQQIVFCGVHYHGKTITAIATELQKTDAEVRQILKESFTIIRSNRDNATVHQ